MGLCRRVSESERRREGPEKGEEEEGEEDENNDDAARTRIFRPAIVSQFDGSKERINWR